MAALHSSLQKKIDTILAIMVLVGHPMKIIQGVRTVEEQTFLFAKGRTTPGPKVTNCDGVEKKSRHQVASDGTGHAVDCAFVVDGKISWAEKEPWRLYGELGKAMGLVWGGEWKSLVDRPHLELPG